MNTTSTIAPPSTASAGPRERLGALWERFGQFLIYAVIGIGAVAIDIGAFAVLVTGLGWDALLGNTLSTLLAAIASFLANSFANFKVTDRMLVRFVSFGIVVVIGYLVSTLIIAVGVGALALDPLVAKAISLPIVLILQFTLNKKITFGSRLGRTAS